MRNILGQQPLAGERRWPAVVRRQQQPRPLDSASALQEGFTYTKTGDRTSKTLAGQAPQVYGYLPGTHRLGDIDSVPRDYDANGNTTELPDVPYPLVYDDRNRLAQTQFHGLGGTATYAYGYNGKGERVRKAGASGNGTTTQTAVYDEGGRLLHDHMTHECGGGSESFAMGGALCAGERTVELVYLDDMPVAQITDGAISYLETDHLGTPRIAADPATNAWQWKWNFFGSAFGDHAATPAPTGGIEVSLRYPGQQYDAEAGLHYNMARDYEPATGRYIESDPIGLRGGINTYGYVSQSPLSAADPSGQFEVYGYELYDGTWRFRFDFNSRCILGIQPRNIRRGPGRMANILLRVQSAIEPGKSGIDDVETDKQCICLSYDAALSSYFKSSGHSTGGIYGGKSYTEAKARQILDDLREEMRRLRREKCIGENCPRDEFLYPWGTLIDKAKARGANYIGRRGN